MSQADWVNQDFYQTLGVAKDADQAAIKKAYRKLARENHPDSNPDDQAKHERFKKVAEAYDVLSDEKKRQEYDQIRTYGIPSGFPGGFGGQNFDMDLGDLFGGMFGGGRGRQQGRRAQKGHDFETETTISFVDAVQGCEISLNLSGDAACSTCSGTGGKPGTKPHVCSTCQGVGTVGSMRGGFMLNETCPNCRGRQVTYDEVCASCRGTGHAAATRKVSARIPAGINDGGKLRLKGKGGPGQNGGPAGDLLIRVKVQPHKLFGRKGNHLTLSVPVTFAEASLGAEITVPTLSSGKVKLRVPAGTATGQTLRVRGRGVPAKTESGDLLVTLTVTIPKTLTESQRAAIAQLASEDTDPRSELFGD